MKMNFDEWTRIPRDWMFCGVLALLGSVCPLAAEESSASESAEDRPNIVLLFIDDWAWNGTPIQMDDEMLNSGMPVAEMPNLERMAAEGMKFRNAYSGAPQCSPSRACLQTGQTAARTGYTVYMGETGDPVYDIGKKYEGFPVIANAADQTLDPDAVTIPEALKPLGYVSAHIGKWHLRGDPSDEGYVMHDGDTNNNPGNTVGKVSRQPKEVKDPKLMFDITDKSIAFMQKQVEEGNPFYLQISHYAMHAGAECFDATREKWLKHPKVQAYYEKNNTTAEKVGRKSDPAIWLGMLEDLDGRIGAVLDEIEKLGIEDNTYVIMVSDNGYRHKFLPGLTQPFHSTKWWVWQGGIRVPMIVKGPGIEAGSVFHENVVNYDFLPTFVDWAGGDSSTLENIDGVSLAGYLAGEKPKKDFRDRYLYFHYPHYRSGMPHSAIVSGTRKVMHFYERPDVPMLFDLKKDELESKNIASQHPEEHQAMFDEMMWYFDEVGARLPKENPDYDPEVYEAAAEYEMRMRWGPFEGKRELEADEVLKE